MTHYLARRTIRFFALLALLWAVTCDNSLRLAASESVTTKPTPSAIF